MKPYHVALFKHFIDSKGMTTVFISNFKNYPLKRNPKSIEEFLRQVSEEEVCLQAFYFVINARWGYDYWLNMQKEFMELLKEHEDDEGQDKWYLFHGKCKILRNNWDTRHWKQESKADTAKRYGAKELPEYATSTKDEAKEDAKLIEFYDGDEKKDDEDDEKLDIKTYIKGKPEEKKSIFREFEFLDIRQRPSSHRRLMDDEVSINTKNEHKKITFNQKISKEIKKRGGYEYAAILKNKKGDIALILNDEKGVTIQDGGARENSNVIISHKELVGKVVKFLNITNEYEIAKVTEIEKTNDYVAYILTKIKK